MSGAIGAQPFCGITSFLCYIMQVAQVAAKTLGIPMALIKIKPTNTLVNANDSVTGGSITSELVCQVNKYVMFYIDAKNLPPIEIQHLKTKN